MFYIFCSIIFNVIRLKLNLEIKKSGFEEFCFLCVQKTENVVLQLLLMSLEGCQGKFLLGEFIL